jgi:hypothetical protein
LQEETYARDNERKMRHVALNTAFLICVTRGAVTYTEMPGGKETSLINIHRMPGGKESSLIHVRTNPGDGAKPGDEARPAERPIDIISSIVSND